MTLHFRSRFVSTRRVAVATGVVAVSVLALTPGIAAATTTYTWSGTDAAAGTNSNLGDPGNWAGAAAPASGTTVNLDFPSLGCGTSACGNNPVNDLTKLNVAAFDLGLTTQDSGPGYDLTGTGASIGTLNITSATPTGASGQGANINVPLALDGSELWSIDAENNSNVNLGAVSGKSTYGLTVDLPVANGLNGGGFVGVPSFETGPLTFQGYVGDPYSYVTGATAYNAKTHQSVTFDQGALFETGPVGKTAGAVTVKYGPLTISNSTVFLGNGSGGPYGIDSVAGNASLDSGTNLNFNALEPGAAKKPVAGLTYPQIKATGNVSLGSANLTLFAACSQKFGAVYTLVKAASVTGTFQNLSNGTIFQANGDGSPSCASGSAPYLRINYGTSTATVTVVAAPPGGAARLHGPSTTSLVPRLSGHSVQLVREG